MRRRTRQLLMASWTLAAIAAAPFAIRWSCIDTCLDRGAAWDYAIDACVTTYQPAPP